MGNMGQVLIALAEAEEKVEGINSFLVEALEEVRRLLPEVDSHDGVHFPTPYYERPHSSFAKAMVIVNDALEKAGVDQDV